MRLALFVTVVMQGYSLPSDDEVVQQQHVQHDMLHILYMMLCCAFCAFCA